MIALRNDCLLFELSNGESIPCSPAMICVEFVDGIDNQLEPDLLRHAAASVFHYFKVELQRESVTVGEFSLALEKVLRHLGYTINTGGPDSEIHDTDLARLIRDTGGSLELFFFPRLRDELRDQLRRAPRIVRFRGLRRCVKQIAGARRWSIRCEQLQDQIVAFLRQCMDSEADKPGCALLVE